MTKFKKGDIPKGGMEQPEKVLRHCLQKCRKSAFSALAVLRHGLQTPSFTRWIVWLCEFGEPPTQPACPAFNSPPLPQS